MSSREKDGTILSEHLFEFTQKSIVTFLGSLVNQVEQVKSLLLFF